MRRLEGGSAAAGTRRLPPRRDHLVGRRRELRELRALLRECRLVTITGAGGVGKTRLAVELAHTARVYPDGAYFVDLAPLRSLDEVLTAVAAAISLDDAGADPLLRILGRIGDARALFVFDNFEHILVAVPVVGELIGRGPRLGVLVTSRAQLRLAGERVYELRPLPVPDSALDARRLLEAPAVSLFAERARRQNPGFRLDRCAPAVARVCRALDGLPLAIELAAAWSDILSPEAIEARLSQRLEILRSDGGDRTPRHRSLRAALDWSYELLDPDEQRCFRALSVFAGGFTPEAVASISVGEPTIVEVLSRLRALAEKSLLLTDTSEEEARFTMLETVREYSRERLTAREREEALARLARFLATLAERAEPELVGAAQASWLDRVGAEHSNVRVALQWCLEHDRADLGIPLASALFRYWENRAYFAEGLRWSTLLLALPSAQRHTLRAKALTRAATLAWRLGDEDATERFEQEALAIRRRSGDLEGLAETLHNFGYLHHRRGDQRRATESHTECLEIRERLGDIAGIAAQLNALGEIARAEEDWSRAREFYDGSLAKYRQVGDLRGVAVVTHNVAHVRKRGGDLAGAARLFAESLVLAQRLANRRVVAEDLAGLAGVALSEGEVDRAALLLGAADRLFAETGALLNPADRMAHDTATEQTRERLGPERFRHEWSRGAKLTTDAAVGVALGEPGAPVSAAERSQQLSPRQREIVALVARGLRNREIATALGISEGTARAHVEQILTRLDLRSRVELAAWAAGRSATRSRPE
jgi:non-specific serine/threonine protein kinase